MDLGKEANKSEIDLAAEILTCTLKGLAHSLTKKSADTDDWVSNLLGESKEELRDLQGKFTPIDGQKAIWVPRSDKAM